MKFGAFPRLGRISALIVFALTLSGLGLCGTAAQPLPLSIITAQPLSARLDKPLNAYQLGDIPLQRGTEAELLQMQAAAQRATSRPGTVAAAAGPLPSAVSPQFLDLTTVPRPPLVGSSTLSFEKHPHWSWDQQSIYFASNHPGGASNYGTVAPPNGARFHIFRMSSDGNSIAQITGMTPLEANREQTFPALNYSGTKLAFVERDPATGQSQLFILDFFTNARTQLTGPGANAVNNPLNAEIRAVEHPSWSPNDNAITFSAVNVDANVRNIYVVDTSSKFVRQLTNATVASGVNCKDPVYDPTSSAAPRITFAANAPSVNGATGDLVYSANPLVDLRNDGSANDINNNLFRIPETNRSAGNPIVQLTFGIEDDIEPAYNRSINPPGSGPGAFSGWLAWASLGRDTGTGRGTTYDIYFSSGAPETSPATTARPVRLFTPDTNGGSIALNQSEERYPTWSAGLPLADPINRIAFSSNRQQVVNGETVQITVGDPATQSDIWVADAWDITPPTLFYVEPTLFPGEVLHIANQPLPNPGSRIGQAGDNFYFYARVLDGQYGVESVWAQIKDPDGARTDAQGVNHRLYGAGSFPGPNSPSNNVFIVRRDGNNAPTHYLHVPFETDMEGISVSDYTYFVDGRPAVPDYPTRSDITGLRARFASKNPGVDDFPRWSGNQNSTTNPILTSNRPPIINGQQAWLQLKDDGVFPDLKANDDIYSAVWQTPNVPSDYYVDLIAYDKAFNPQNPTQQQNWIIYDNIHGFSTQPFVSTRDVLFVDDYGAGQKWLRGSRGAFRRFPSFRLGHESDIIERPNQYYPQQWFAAGGGTLQPVQDPGGSASGFVPETFDFLQNGYDFISWSASNPTPRGTLRAYHYDQWRILAKGPIPEPVINNYVPTTEEQPRSIDGKTRVQQPIARRAILWNAPYTGDIFSGGGTILDQATQALLTTYKNRAGRLVVAGGDILWALNLGSTGTVNNAFARDILGAQTFNGDASPNTANYTGQPLAQAITRDVVGDNFAPGTDPPIFWGPIFDPEVIGANNDFLDVPNHGNNTSRSANADATPFETNDTFSPAPGWQSVYDGKWAANSDSATQSKTVFISNSLASVGRFFYAPDDQPATPLVVMNYRAKISHAMFCWMFSADLQGRVTNIDQGGAPISGALVEALQGGTVVGSALTNTDGFYQIRGLPVGGWGLRVSSPGFVSFNKATSEGAHGLGLSLEDVQMKEAGPGSISGRVVDQAGQAVPGVTIQAVLRASDLYKGQRTYTTVTGPDGRYTINNVPAGDQGNPAQYDVTVTQLPALFINAQPDGFTNPVGVITSKDTPNINFTAEGQPGPLTVRVFEEVNGAKGSPISGAEVALLDASNTVVSGVQPSNPLNTDGTGTAAFTTVPAGPVSVVAFKSGYTEAIQVVPIPQQNAVDILLSKAPIRPLYGLVVRGGTNQPLQPEDLDTPVTIKLLRKLSRLPVATANVTAVQTLGTQQYNVHFPTAQDGEYILAFEDPNHPRFLGGAEVSVIITENSNNPNFAPSLALQGRAGVVRGVVKEDTNGKPPVQGATVTITPGTGAPTVLTTAADGSFATNGTLPAGAYNVTVSKFGYTSPASLALFVAGDRDLGEVLMTPSPRGEVYGLVTRSTDGLPRDVKVRFTPTTAPNVFFDVQSSTSTSPGPDNAPQNYSTLTATTDQTNSPAVNLPAGTYTISIAPDPRFSGFTVVGGNTVTIMGNDRQRKNLTVTPASGTLSGTVRDANTNAVIVGAVVLVKNATGTTTITSTQTNANGQFTTTVLPGGNYRLEITHPNYEDLKHPAVAASQSVEGNTVVTPNPLLLTPKPPSAISGVVRSKVDDTPIEGVTVQLLFPNGTPVSPAVTATTSGTVSQNPTRNYLLAPVAPGDYIVRVTKSGWKVAQQNVTILPGVNRTGLDFRLDPEHLFGAGLLLISLPDQYSQDAAGLLNLGEGERTAYWLPDENRYAIFPSDPEARFFTPGKGMFVRLHSPRAFFQSGTPVPNTPFNLAVKAGWNLIGSPRRQRIEWLKVRVLAGGVTMSMQEAMNQGIIGNGLFGYQDGYFRSDTLDPFRGYFMRALQPCTLIIPVDNSSASASTARGRKVAGAATPSLSQVAAELESAGLAPRAQVEERAHALRTMYQRLLTPQASSLLPVARINRSWISRTG